MAKKAQAEWAKIIAPGLHSEEFTRNPTARSVQERQQRRRGGIGKLLIKQ
jgi:hypothetical protein